MLAFAPSFVSICLNAAMPFSVGRRSGWALAPAFARKRVHCGVAKKNSLFFTTGPPTDTPKVLVIWTGFLLGSGRPKARSAGNAHSLRGLFISQPEPCPAFVPRF